MIPALKKKWNKIKKWTTTIADAQKVLMGKVITQWMGCTTQQKISDCDSFLRLLLLSIELIILHCRGQCVFSGKGVIRRRSLSYQPSLPQTLSLYSPSLYVDIYDLPFCKKDGVQKNLEGKTAAAAAAHLSPTAAHHHHHYHQLTRFHEQNSLSSHRAHRTLRNRKIRRRYYSSMLKNRMEFFSFCTGSS